MISAISTQIPVLPVILQYGMVLLEKHYRYRGIGTVFPKFSEKITGIGNGNAKMG